MLAAGVHTEGEVACVSEHNSANRNKRIKKCFVLRVPSLISFSIPYPLSKEICIVSFLIFLFNMLLALGARIIQQTTTTCLTTGISEVKTSCQDRKN